MHSESYALMQEIVDKLLQNEKIHAGGRVLDVGSYDVNGTYKPIFEDRNFIYTGLDISPGPNVDIVANIYNLKGLENAYDLVISGQALEHLEFPLLAAQSIKNCIRPGGWAVLIAPAEWPVHRHPIDCWRILPDGMSFLLEGFINVETFLRGKDTVGFGQKPRNYTERWRIVDTRE